MQVIILNTEQEFNQLNNAIHQWAKVNVPKYKAQRWSQVNVNENGKYVMVIDSRLNGFDFTQYIITEL